MAENLTLINKEDIPTGKENHFAELAKAAIESCPKIKKEREKEILFERFGIGKSAKTLNAIGKNHGVTRERIRQIVNNGIKKIQKNGLNAELKKQVTEIEKAVQTNGGALTAIDLFKKFAPESTNEQNGVRFIANLSTNLEVIKESNSLKTGWAKKGIKLTKIKEVAKKATELLKTENKTLTTDFVAEKLGEEKEFINAILSVTKAIMADDNSDWGLTAWPHVNPKSIREKSKYIMIRHGKPIHYTELTQKISDMGHKNVTKQSVHNELIKNGDFVLVGRGIYALTEWGYQPGVVEEVIVEILEGAGSPMHKSEIIEKVLEKRIVKVSTIVLNLQKDRFKRVGKGTYTLN